MKKSRRLGGWWRLWLVGSAIWISTVAAGLGPRPTLDEYGVGPAAHVAFNFEFPIDTAGILAELENKPNYRASRDTLIRLAYRALAEDDLKGGSVARQKLLDSLTKAIGTTPRESLGRFQEAMLQEYAGYRNAWWKDAIARTLGPPLALLLAALVARWIWRGFRPVST